MYSGSICDVKGLLVGHAQNEEARTGCTVLFAEDGFVAFGASILWDFMDYYDTKRLSTQKMSEGISVLKDIPYTENADEYQLLDIYYPEGETEKRPVIIDIHGGGLMYGDKDMNRIYASIL